MLVTQAVVVATKERSEGQMRSQAIPPRTSDDGATDTASVLGTIGNNVSMEKSVKKGKFTWAKTRVGAAHDGKWVWWSSEVHGKE